jgi:type IV secretion system pilin
MKYKILLLIITITSVLLINTIAIQAQGLEGKAAEELAAQNEAFLQEAGLGSEANLSEVVSSLIKILLSFLGVIFVVLIIYAGFLWMTSAGNEEKIGKAKKTMTAAIIGLAIVLAAYSITWFVLDTILEATKGGQGLD